VKRSKKKNIPYYDQKMEKIINSKISFESVSFGVRL
jgi:hypothetical protein